MSKFKFGFITALLILAAYGFSAAQTVPSMEIKLDPGLYTYKSQIMQSGRVILDEDPYEYCLEIEDTHTNLQEQVAKLIDGEDCAVSNISQTSNSAKGDFSCYVPDFGMTMAATIEGKYTASQ